MTKSLSNSARADVFNRLYVSAMFAMIVAIGSFGTFALARSQQGSSSFGAGGVTVLAILLMAGLAVLLGRYKRAADASAAATLATLRQAALTHNLTKLGNDRSFYDDFEREIARAERHDHSLVLAMIDVDDFKAIRGSSPGAVSVFSQRKADAVRIMIAQELVSTAFQPIWDMQNALPLGFEALARPFPELGLSGPQEAFDVAQRIHRLPELDRLCTRKALEAAAHLAPGSVIFLNHSPASLSHSGFDPRAFAETVRAAGFVPEQIVIELTERRIDDSTIVAQRVAALRALGVRIALDDTGRGHAGLEILSKVRFDFVKIDRGLIVDAMESQEARGVLAGIIAIARETGSYLIAEGIENGEMLDFVHSAHRSKASVFGGVRGIQGYLLGKPELDGVDPAALERHHDFLAARQLAERTWTHSLEVVSGEESASDARRASASSHALN